MTLDEIVALDIKEIRARGKDDLDKLVRDIREQLYALRFRKVTDVVENPAIVRRVRRVNARIATVLREQANLPKRRHLARASRPKGKTPSVASR